MYIILLMLCGLQAIRDIRTKTVDVRIWTIAGLVGLIGNMIQKEEDLFWIGKALLVGGFVIVCSYISKGSIGIGDGIVFLALGLCVGAEETSQILFYSLCLCCIWGIGRILFKKASRTEEIPFLPFIFLAMLGNLFW